MSQKAQQYSSENKGLMVDLGHLMIIIEILLPLTLFLLHFTIFGVITGSAQCDGILGTCL